MKKIKKNWNVIKNKIDKLRAKIKKKLNKKKAKVNIKKENKILLSIKNFTNNKIKRFFMKAFPIKEVKEVMILLTLSRIKTFLRFHISLFKKAL